jgi:Domain of unknown function (DUF892)
LFHSTHSIIWCRPEGERWVSDDENARSLHGRRRSDNAPTIRLFRIQEPHFNLIPRHRQCAFAADSRASGGLGQVRVLRASRHAFFSQRQRRLTPHPESLRRTRLRDHPERGEVADKQVLDAAIVGSAQAVEHYEIARYGTLVAWADELGRDDIVRLLTTNLNEEKAADKKLSTVALRKGVNRKAAS